MSNKLKAITTKAKALYKTGKFAKWTDAIKAASKSTSKIGATKKVVKKVVKKKAAPKKKAVAKSYHKDTASHNVKISVVSGISKGAFNMLKVWENVYGKLAQEYISTTNAKDKQRIKKEMYTVKLILSDIKKLKTF